MTPAQMAEALLRQFAKRAIDEHEAAWRKHMLFAEAAAESACARLGMSRWREAAEA